MQPVEHSAATKTAPPRISVVLPNYNHCHYLKTSLPALLNQTCAAYEIIVVDDGSTDDSVAYVEALRKEHPAIGLLRHEKNQGVIAALNHGVAAATGEVIYLSAADDETYPGLFAEATRLLAAHPEAGLFCSDGAHFDEAEGTMQVHHLGLPETPAHHTPAEFLPCLRKLPIFFFDSHTVLFRRAYFAEAGGLAPELGYRTDWFLYWVVAARHGICYSPKVLAKFLRRRAGYSMSSSANDKIEQQVWCNVMARLRQPAYRDVWPFLLTTTLYTDSELTLRRLVIALAGTPANWRMLRPGLVGTWLRRRYSNLVRRTVNWPRRALARLWHKRLRPVYKIIRRLIMESW